MLLCECRRPHTNYSYSCTRVLQTYVTHIVTCCVHKIAFALITAHCKLFENVSTKWTVVVILSTSLVKRTTQCLENYFHLFMTFVHSLDTGCNTMYAVINVINVVLTVFCDVPIKCCLHLSIDIFTPVLVWILPSIQGQLNNCLQMFVEWRLCEICLREIVTHYCMYSMWWWRAGCW